MPDALKLIEVSNDAGFRHRVGFYLQKKALDVLGETTPDGNALVLAKVITKNSGNVYLNSYYDMLVTGSAAGNALESAGYVHSGISDAQIETAVNNMFNNYGKGLV